MMAAIQRDSEVEAHFFADSGRSQRWETWQWGTTPLPVIALYVLHKDAPNSAKGFVLGLNCIVYVDDPLRGKF